MLDFQNTWCEKTEILRISRVYDITHKTVATPATDLGICSKIFSILLDNRLRLWSESNNLLSDFQFGFRKSKSTVDCIFVFSSIIDKVINHEKKKLYCAFVDFQKAFDLVYRNGIWFKILNMGGSCKIVKRLQAIYSSVKSCVRTNT